MMVLRLALLTLLVTPACGVAASDHSTVVQSPDGRNAIELRVSKDGVTFEVRRDGRRLIGPSVLGPELVHGGRPGDGAVVAGVETAAHDEEFTIPWGKTRAVRDHHAKSVVTIRDAGGVDWQVELKAFDDGVAFRHRVMSENGVSADVRDEATQFDAAGDPVALFNTLDGFTTSHESLYERMPLSEMPVDRLVDCPLLLTWPDGPAAAITEARVREYAGMYLRRESAETSSLRCRLSPLPSLDDVSVTGTADATTSPWRVVLLADTAGELVESSLLLCLNDRPRGDFSWVRPGKTTFHWWYGAFEDDFELADGRDAHVSRHKRYIDFCAENGIAYHSVSGDGYAWYQQSRIDYGTAADDANVCVARPEIGLPEILRYAEEKGVGVRLWVHWKPLSKQLEEAMTTYEAWGVKGLMVDFLDRDDQEMLAFVDRMLESAARHKVHIQIHGSSKYSGEQRTFPNLLNREGVLNLEYSKWSDQCSPAHAVNVAYTRALAGPVDFHLGGFRAVPREEFRPLDRAPNVMGTRCHQLALYVAYENPMPIVADGPEVYEGQPGFEFLRDVPTTWDETRFVTGEAGEFFVVARRAGDVWWLGGITNWTGRSVDVPLAFLGGGRFEASLYTDGPGGEATPNELERTSRNVTAADKLPVSMASGGGFVATVRPRDAKGTR